jgi:hypothetical protein
MTDIERIAKWEKAKRQIQDMKTILESGRVTSLPEGYNERLQEVVSNLLKMNNDTEKEEAPTERNFATSTLFKVDIAGVDDIGYRINGFTLRGGDTIMIKIILTEDFDDYIMFRDCLNNTLFNISVSIYKKNGEVSRTLSFKRCLPVRISDITFDWETKDERSKFGFEPEPGIMEFVVDFSIIKPQNIL